MFEGGFGNRATFGEGSKWSNMNLERMDVLPAPWSPSKTNFIFWFVGRVESSIGLCGGVWEIIVREWNFEFF